MTAQRAPRGTRGSIDYGGGGGIYPPRKPPALTHALRKSQKEFSFPTTEAGMLLKTNSM
jgi:hypothetical protein